jgi:LAO/AO transport system kinase
MPQSAAPPLDIADLAARVKTGDRRALAQAITLVESTRAPDRAAAEDLQQRLLGATGGALRLGISGPPGVGKSTFIEKLGLHLTEVGRRVAVLAIDPSSKVSGGSILGDKTRMVELARHPNAYIRPSPAGETLGGVARRTREALLLCEAAGFDVAIVETVGVGQSESAVADLVDILLLLIQPGGGDDLQGIKRGVIELADMLVVTKSDGELAAAANRTAGDYANAMRLLRAAAEEPTPVLQCSGLTGAGIPELWTAILDMRARREQSGAWPARRGRQAKAWLWNEISESLIAALKSDPGVARRLPDLEKQVEAGRTTPSAAARELLGKVGEGGA